MRKQRIHGLAIILVAFLGMLSGCGGSSNDAAPSASTTPVSGSVYAAPVYGASVVVLNSAGTTTIAGPVTTASDGTYSIGIPSSALTGTLLFRSNGGSFIDEATSATTTAGSLAAYMPAAIIGSGASVNLDPSSTITADLVRSHGMTNADAAAAFTMAFGYTPDASIAPINAPYSASSSTAQRLAGLRAMAFSQLTKDLGLSPDKQFDLFSAIADDLADDSKLNGSALASIGTTTIPKDLQNRFERALMNCLTNTVHNLTGLTVDQVGMLSFSKFALTQTYRVEYVPMSMMAPAVGKTMFQIRITNRSDGSHAAGLTVTLMPVMHMSTKNHGTPVDAVTESSTPGTYDCTAYYLMPSGLNMGIWELKVMIGMGMGAESATFYPSVGMTMGTDTVVQRLYGPADIVSGPSVTQYTRYILFQNGSVSASSGTLKLMISHAENMMMYFNPVSIGSVLSSPTGTVTSMVVSAATDTAFTSPVSGTDDGNGHWSITGFTGLSSGVTTTIYVKLNVNGEDKTTNGAAASGANAYTSFIVTPR
jgi:hypothetical protein